MTLALKHRNVPDSPLARWDARWKLAALLVAAGGIAALDGLAPTVVALGLALGLLALCRLPRGWVVGRLGLFAFAALPFLLVLPFTLDLSGPGWTIGPVRISELGLTSGLAVFGRCVAIGALSLVLVGTAPVHHALAAAHRLKVPGLLVRVTLLAYRYAFLLASEHRRVWVAMRARGFRISSSRHAYRSVGHAVGAILVRGADRADHVADAMRCRGFAGRFHTLTTFRTTPADIMSFVLLTAAVVGLLLWDRQVLS